MTVCQVQRNNAEERVRKVLYGQVKKNTTDGQSDGDIDPDEIIDVEQMARD
jgi:hypothetical protein